MKNLARHPLMFLIGATTVCGLITIVARDRAPIRLSNLLQTRRRSTQLALTTLPGRQVWQKCLALFAIYSLIAFSIGLISGFLRVELLKGSWPKYVFVAACLFIEPGILEELLFRVWLLPQPEENVSLGRKIVGSVAGLAAFVLAHPINGLTISRSARALFTDLAFLLQATLLGLTCSLAYLISGSIWPPVFIHWLPVTVWILFFGGAKRVARAEWYSRT